MVENGDVIELEAGDTWASVHPNDGGRIGQIEVAERALLHDDPSGGPLTWGSYPLVPWGGRIRNGTFEFDGHLYHVPRNLEPHAIHGTGFTSRWQVVDQGRDYCDLQCELRWPFGGRAHQHIQLDESGVTCLLSAYATSVTMPAVVGWHPCFRKPDRAELEFAAMHVRDAEHVALAERTPPRAHPWDDCFVEPLGPLRLHYPDLTVTIESDCDHWVVYDEPAEMTCVEPQSGPPDAFTIGGATRLVPGDVLQRYMNIRWATHR